MVGQKVGRRITMKRIRRQQPLRQSDDRARIPGQGPRRNRRSGIESFELILVGPVLWMITLALFEFGFLVLILQALMTGTGEAAREAAKFGMTTEQRLEAAVEVIRRFLAPHDIDFDRYLFLHLENGPADSVDFVPVSLPFRVPLECNPPPGAVAADSVRVTICIRVTDARVPDWLAKCGLSLFLADRRFEISAVVPKE